MARYRQRKKGESVPAPKPLSRRSVINSIADVVTYPEPAHGLSESRELVEARAELVRLAGMVQQANDSRRNLKRELVSEKGLRVKTEGALRFLSIAFARTIKGTNTQNATPPLVRERLTEWLPEGENPWR